MKERIVRMCARGKVAINLRGMEYLQAQSGEDEDAAWKRLRPKLTFTGRQLDEVILLQPSAVPSMGGATPPAPPAGEPPAGGLFGGDGVVAPTSGSGEGGTRSKRPLARHHSRLEAAYLVASKRERARRCRTLRLRP